MPEAAHRCPCQGDLETEPLLGTPASVATRWEVLERLERGDTVRVVAETLAVPTAWVKEVAATGLPRGVSEGHHRIISGLGRPRSEATRHAAQELIDEWNELFARTGFRPTAVAKWRLTRTPRDLRVQIEDRHLAKSMRVKFESVELGPKLTVRHRGRIFDLDLTAFLPVPLLYTWGIVDGHLFRILPLFVDDAAYCRSEIQHGLAHMVVLAERLASDRELLERMTNHFTVPPKPGSG